MPPRLEDMPEEGRTEKQLLDHAKELEKNFDWMSAAKTYEALLKVIPQSELDRLGEVLEALGYARYRYAMQSSTPDEFKGRIERARKSYTESREFYEKAGDEKAECEMRRCDAWVAFLDYWVSDSPPKKRELLAEAWRSTKQTLDTIERLNDHRRFVEIFNQLDMCGDLLFYHIDNFQERDKIISESASYGERAIQYASGHTDKEALAIAYAKVSKYLEILRFHNLGLEESPRYEQKAIDYWRKAWKLSEQAASLEIPGHAFWNKLPFVRPSQENRQTLQKALKCAETSGDRLATGSALLLLAGEYWWTLPNPEDSDQYQEWWQAAVQYAEKAGHEFASISFVSPANDGGLWLPEMQACFDTRTAWWESDPKRKREYAEKALEECDRLVQRAEASGYPDVIQGAHDSYSGNLTSLAKTESDPQRRKDLFEQALKEYRISIEIWKSLYPRQDDQVVGTSIAPEAEIEAEIAALTGDSEERLKLLQTAIGHMTQGTEALQRLESKLVIKKQTEALSLWGSFTGRYLLECAHWQASLGEFDTSYLLEAAKSYLNAAESHRRTNFPNRVAECYWLAAQQYSVLGDHFRAAEVYMKASQEYANAAEKLPQLKGFYAEHATYMLAWSEIESARHQHARQDAGAARKHFAKAAELHNQTTRWAFLAPNYSAWVEVERGEDLSRDDLSEEAIEVFQKAAGLFEEARSSIHNGMDRLDIDEEQKNASRLIAAAELRREYCLGRVEIEEARLLDKKGDELASSEKYGRAAETFERILGHLESEQDQREIRSIATLSKAWQMMARAEAESLPELFDQASELFDQAKDLSQGENPKLLALGHSRFCKALGTAMKFADSGDESHHASATQNLEAAAKYYLRAGLKADSEYAKASKLLLDGYLYMGKAAREEDQAKKAKLYAMTEKVLEASGASFANAHHERKRKQVLALLDKVKEDRQLAASLAEVLQAPDSMSTTKALESPTPTQEMATGVERFEHSDIQATIVVRHKEINVGEDLQYEVELVNAGRVPAQLTKIEGIAPSGFEVVGKPDNYRLEENHLNMKGRRLDSLKTEDVKLSIRPTTHGRFVLQPRVLYIDESGYYKLRQLEPVEIVVKELGISGWLKGPEKKKQTA